MKLPRAAGDEGERSGDDLAQQKLALCSSVVGEAFFPALVEALSQALSVRCVLLCTIHPLDRNRVRTVAAWDRGPMPNLEYDLADTPCANIIGQGTCRYAAGIADLFPADTMLREMGAESYVGAPLRSASGEVLGLLADGLTNRQIGQRLGISPHTVARHVTHARSKLGLRSRAQLAVWAGRHTP